MSTLAPTVEDVAPLLEAFGQRHTVIQKLGIFGSVAAGQASDESDVDVLVTFGAETPLDMRYFDTFTRLRQELQVVIGRKVDLVDRHALRHDLFGYNAVQHLKTVYERS